MASASGPAGRPTPSETRRCNGESTSDKAAGERQVSQTQAAVTSPTEARRMITLTAVLTTVPPELTAPGAGTILRQHAGELSWHA